MMITEQVIAYIKDQLARGISRDKIKSNLTAAGWLDADVTQAFSFAEPKGESAALKIAPSFAVENAVVQETPIDKSSLATENSYIPILKRDSTSGDTVPVENPISKKIEQSPILQPFQTSSMMSSPSTNVAVSPSTIMPGRSTESAEKPLRTFGDEGIVMKPKTSGALKSLAVFLFLIFIVGNLFLWMVVYPGLSKQNPLLNQNTDVTMQAQAAASNQTGRTNTDNILSEDSNPATVVMSDELNVPAQVLGQAAGAYYAANNSFGTTVEVMVNCTSATGVFTDNTVKKALNDISTISKSIPKCSLSADDATKPNRITSYLVYIPMQTGAFCIDSTGAAFSVSQEPKGTFCAEAI